MWSCPYIHDVSLDDYMMMVLPSLCEVAFTFYDDIWSVKAWGLIIGFLSMCEVMVLHMNNALEDYDLGYDHDLKINNVKWSEVNIYANGCN